MPNTNTDDTTKTYHSIIGPKGCETFTIATVGDDVACYRCKCGASVFSRTELVEHYKLVTAA